MVAGMPFGTLLLLPSLAIAVALEERTGEKYVNYIIEGLPNASIGGTHLILSFLEPSTASIPGDHDDAWVKYAVAEYANLPAAARGALLSSLHKGGTLVLASVGGAAAVHSIYSKYDPLSFGRRAAKYVVDLGLDGLDIDLEGWGNDPNGYAFLKAATKGAFDYFKQLGDNKHYTITHAPEMPDFWHGTLYAALMSDKDAFDMIDFCNVQFYNQLEFPDADHVFTKDIYAPAIHAPTALATIAQSIANASKGTVSLQEVQAKLLLGFPCRDGSFPVGGSNLNLCGQPQFDLVKHGVSDLGYPLAGVFEWTASAQAWKDRHLDWVSSLVEWNAKMRQAIGGATPGPNMVVV